KRNKINKTQSLNIPHHPGNPDRTSYLRKIRMSSDSTDNKTAKANCDRFQKCLWNRERKSADHIHGIPMAKRSDKTPSLGVTLTVAVLSPRRYKIESG